MPFTSAGANRMLDGLVVGDVWAHLHAGTPATSGNVVTGTGYAGVRVGAFRAEVAGQIRRRTNAGSVSFPTPGGAWTRAGAVGLWDRQNIAANPADPPGLLREAALSAGVTGALNDAIVIPAGRIDIEIEVTD